MKINRLLLTTISTGLLLLFISGNLEAQTKNPDFCELPAPWDKIQISREKIPDGVAKIFVITNRPYFKEAEKNEIFPNDIAAFRKVSYLIAVCDGQSWQLHVVSSFAEGMREINDGRDILLFIEGHGKTLPMALNRAFQVQARYDVALVVFDWPSKNRNFNSSLARVRRCGDNFYNLLLQIEDYRPQHMKETQHFSIFAHSLGNYFLSNLVVCGDAQYLRDVFIDNIVLNAAAIRSKEHGEVLSQLGFQTRLYITSNKYDWVLRGANLLTSGKMLGNFAIQPLVTNAGYVNFTGIVGKEHSYYFGFHPFEQDNPSFFYFYKTALHGDEVNLQDTNLFSPRAEGDGYNVTGADK